MENNDYSYFRHHTAQHWERLGLNPRDPARRRKSASRFRPYFQNTFTLPSDEYDEARRTTNRASMPPPKSNQGLMPMAFSGYGSSYAGYGPSFAGYGPSYAGSSPTYAGYRHCFPFYPPNPYPGFSPPSSLEPSPSASTKTTPDPFLPSLLEPSPSASTKTTPDPYSDRAEESPESTRTLMRLEQLVREQLNHAKTRAIVEARALVAAQSIEAQAEMRKDSRDFIISRSKTLADQEKRNISECAVDHTADRDLQQKDEEVGYTEINGQKRAYDEKEGLVSDCKAKELDDKSEFAVHTNVASKKAGKERNEEIEMKSGRELKLHESQDADDPPGHDGIAALAPSSAIVKKHHSSLVLDQNSANRVSSGAGKLIALCNKTTRNRPGTNITSLVCDDHPNDSMPIRIIEIEGVWNNEEGSFNVDAEHSLLKEKDASQDPGLGIEDPAHTVGELECLHADQDSSNIVVDTQSDLKKKETLLEPKFNLYPSLAANGKATQQEFVDKNTTLCQGIVGFRDDISPRSSDLESIGSSCDAVESTEASDIAPASPNNIKGANGAVSSALGVVQQALIDRVMVGLNLNGSQQGNIRNHAGDGSSSGNNQSEQTHPSCFQGQGGSGESSGHSGGRQANSDDSNNTDGGNPNGFKPNSITQSPAETDLRRLFACPYFKRNPEKHHKYKSCAGPGWKDIHRLKEHLYRRHALPFRCKRCFTVFDTFSKLEGHYTSDQPCDKSADVEEADCARGFDKDQDRLLRSRKRDLTLRSEDDRWRKVYRILFPLDAEHSIPSPYYESEHSFHDQQDSLDWARFNKFSRKEMPNRVQTLTESLIGGVNQYLLAKIPEIVRQAQEDILRDYRASYPDTRIPHVQEQSDQSIYPNRITVEHTAPTLHIPSNDSSNVFNAMLEDPILEGWNIPYNTMSYSDSAFGSGDNVLLPSQPSLGAFGNIEMGIKDQHERMGLETDFQRSFLTQEAALGEEQIGDVTMGLMQ